MYPSKPHTGASASGTESGSSQPFPNSSGEKQVPPSTDFAYQSSNPSAPLLPSSSNNPAAPNMEPPPYSSVVAQDSGDWKNRSSSFSGGTNLRPYPPAAPHVTGAKSASGLDTQAPYPTGPGAPSGPTGYAPYPTGPGAGPPYGGSAPYPTGPGLGSGITSQPPYSTGPGFPGPGNQPPYPTGSMPMPGPVDTDRQIGFTAPVTMAPKPGNVGYPQGGYQGSAIIPNQGMQPGVIYPTVSGEHQYMQSPQYATSGYQQQQQPNTIYVVQKAPERSSTDDDCCLFACCLASCYCLCECIKICASDS